MDRNDAAPGVACSAPLGRDAEEQLVSDFTVRLYQRGPHRARVEVIGNRSGTTASVPCGIGLEWIYALLRALKQAGAYERVPTACGARTASYMGVCVRRPKWRMVLRPTSADGLGDEVVHRCWQHRRAAEQSMDYDVVECTALADHFVDANKMVAA